MDATSSGFRLPTRLENAQGRERRAGFEFEFAGPDVDAITTLIRELWDGTIEKKNRFSAKVTGTPWGDFDAGLDARLLKDRKYLDFLSTLGIEVSGKDDEHWLDEMVERVATVAVPYEISTPPIPFSQLHEVERLRKALHDRNALGTKANTIYAFGMHINPEIPEVTPELALAFIQSFAVHHPWLLQELQIDLTRRITFYIQPYPDAYLDVILAPGYRPDAGQLVRDYLAHNPTRNRALDMLPILCLFDHEAVKAAVQDDKKPHPRPAFHYRLPNCLLDDPEWRIAHEWNCWMSVEELAMDRPRLDRLSAELLEEKAAAPLLWTTPWAEGFQERLAS